MENRTKTVSQINKKAQLESDKECSFKPKLNSGLKIARPYTNLDFQDRLIVYQDQRAVKMENLRQEANKDIQERPKIGVSMNYKKNFYQGQFKEANNMKKRNINNDIRNFVHNQYQFGNN